MARRFDVYKIRRGEDLGNPETWDRRFEDIDLRLAARELDGDKIDDAVDQLTSVALARLNDTFTPVVNEAIERLASVGALFSADSESEITIGAGPRTFLLSADTRTGYVLTDYVAIRPAGDGSRGMIAATTSYDRATGLLDVNVVQTVGAGTFDAWELRVTSAPDLEHSTRTDNPHQTTAAQVGAYTTAETDTALALKAPLASPALTGNPTAPTQAAGNNSSSLATTAFVQAAAAAVVNGSPTLLDTLKELADAIGDDPNFAVTMTTALGNRLRIDAVQSLTSAQRLQSRTNLKVLGYWESPLIIAAVGALVAADNGKHIHWALSGTTAASILDLPDPATIPGGWSVTVRCAAPKHRPTMQSFGHMGCRLARP